MNGLFPWINDIQDVRRYAMIEENYCISFAFDD